MSSTWHAPEPIPEAIGTMGWMRVILRGIPLSIVTFGSLVLLLVVRIVERPLFGHRRPVTPFIVQFVCRSAFVILGLKFHQTGEVMQGQGAVVSNHASWLDIFSLNARKRVYFVSKAEVANWPGIGLLARATGTVFIRRAVRDASVQVKIFEDRLKLGHKLLFFPEGTSTDGLRVLPFKSTLFAAFYSDALRDQLWIQPVTLAYRAPEGESAEFYGWWGDMDFASHFLKTLAARRQGSVEVVYHDPVQVADFSDRKELAKYCEDQVRGGLNGRITTRSNDES